MRKKARNLKWIIALIAIAAAIFAIGRIYKSSNKETVSPSPSPEDRKTTLMRKGDPTSAKTSFVTFTGCGEELPNYKFGINLPESWDIWRQSTPYSDYFDAREDGNFIIACTNMGVGGGGCGERKLTTFTINGKKEKACYGQVDGVWNFDVNLTTDPKTNATIGIWAGDIEPATLNKMLPSFKIIEN